jgi:hypothetical protein
MSAKLQEELKYLDSKLRERAWENYVQFLEKLLRTLPNSEYARTMHGLIRGRAFEQLLDYADSLASQKYETASQHFEANQLAALVRKYPFPKYVLKKDTKGAALKKFLSAEHRCGRMNKFFSLLQKGRNPYSEPLERARHWIRYVIGDQPDFRCIASECDWGPGAAVGVHGNATNMARKLLEPRWTVSPSAYNYAKAFMKVDPHIFELLTRRGESFYCHDPELFNDLFQSRVRVVLYNKIAFVPKTALVDRTIAIEPSLNGFIQKGVDRFMCKRLKRVGIDLSDQTVNQRLAREGSLPGLLDPFCTIDLSSASDSISIGLCEYVLPPDWFVFLDNLRSRYYSLKAGTQVLYNKFVSMGNGFCFPLETMIFASLCAVAYDEKGLKHDFHVYGDDIIVRQSVVHRVLELLRMCGFKANPKKTFTKGPFRESCGADWFEGQDVRPISLDYAFDSAKSIYKFCNLVVRNSLWKGFFGDSIEFLTELIPKKQRFERPFRGVIDAALEVSLDTFMSSRFAQWNKELFCWSWKEFVEKAKPDKGIALREGYYVALMRGALSGSPSSVPFAERHSTRTKIRRVAYSGTESTWLPGQTQVLSPGLLANLLVACNLNHSRLAA